MKGFWIYFFILLGVARATPAYSTGSGRYSVHTYSSHSSGSYNSSSHNSSSGHADATGHNSTTKHYFNSSNGTAGHTAATSHTSTGTNGTHGTLGAGHSTVNGSNIIGNSTYFKHSPSGEKRSSSSNVSSVQRTSTASNVKKPSKGPAPAVSSISKSKPSPYLPAAPTFLPNYGQ